MTNEIYFAFSEKSVDFRFKRDIMNITKGGKGMGNTTIPFELKHTIRDLRTRQNLTLTEAVKGLRSVGVKTTDRTLGKWEQDSSVLTWSQMQKFAEFYKIPVDYIFFGPNNAFSEKERKRNGRSSSII